MVEFKDQESEVFDKVLNLLKQHSDFQILHSGTEMVISIPGLEIYPERRKVFRDQQEVNLTTKEYKLLCLLVANKGIVLTYEKLYQKVWGEEGLGNESNAVGCHVRNLRGKLYAAAPDTPFTIRCIREIGYCLEFE